ncbi:TSCPD domain-containing protein [Kozakia baliensis]|uniref:TSCPD domain-containing protein n=1 Tax=Kozakia baliensis TaxID=153496 RepID=UPI000495A60B|nr:vitamin B12-dependent ribonucleotide reductase [Kozakia baliensis]
MTARLHWNGVHMRTVHVAADPDDIATHAVTLPTTWDDDAASALLQLSPGQNAVRLTTEAGRWLNEMDRLPAISGMRSEEPLGRSLACLLLLRQIAPIATLWQGNHDRRPGFVVNLAAFVLDGSFAGEQLVASLRLACETLRRLHAETAPMLNGELPFFEAPQPQQNTTETSSGPAGTLLLTNLDACLAQIGLDYDSEAGRDAACFLAWLTTSIARQGAGPVPLPPAACPVPGLAAIGAQVRDEIEEDGYETSHLAPIETSFSAPGPIDALLGVESCGLAPIFSPLRTDGQLRASTLARLAHRGFTPETALASALAGETPLSMPGPNAHIAMHKALTGFVDRMPARPDAVAPLPLRVRLERGMRRPLPSRHGGFTQRASVGGHRLYFRTGEYEDGTLGEIDITPARESSMVRGLLDSVGQAVTIGLQYGAPLDAYVERFAHSRFGPGGTVEGDPVAAYATSLLDYAFRALSDSYLGKRLPDAAPESPETETPDPMLPLDIPNEGASRPKGKLRLVS